MSNAMMIIFPYRLHNTWMFDDEPLGLVQEPFVSGAPEIIDILVQEISNVDEGFNLLSSALPFPGYQAELIWVKEEYNGNWYRPNQVNKEGWLCPAMFKYFDETPKKLYCKAESFYS